MNNSNIKIDSNVFTNAVIAKTRLAFCSNGIKDREINGPADYWSVRGMSAKDDFDLHKTEDVCASILSSALRYRILQAALIDKDVNIAEYHNPFPATQILKISNWWSWMRHIPFLNKKNLMMRLLVEPFIEKENVLVENQKWVKSKWSIHLHGFYLKTFVVCEVSPFNDRLMHQLTFKICRPITGARYAIIQWKKDKK